MTDLERTAQRVVRMREYDEEIKACTDMMTHAQKHRDDITSKAWAQKIRELRAEKHLLREEVEYPRFKTFALVMKTYLTKQQYNEAWERVDLILEHPELIQRND